MAVAPFDVKINDVGYMIDIEQGGPVTPTDLQPGTARAADGEADFIRFEAESAHQITDFSGGAGQRRHVSTNRWLTGLGNGAFGPFYPPYTQLDESGTAGTTSWYFRRGSTLYGKTATNIETIGTSTTVAAAGTPDQAPVQTPNGNVYYTSGGKLFRWDGTTLSTRAGDPVTELLPDDYTIYGTAAFGRHLFAFGSRTFTTSPAVRQSQNFAWNSNITLGAEWPEPTLPGNVLVAFFISDDGEGVVATDTDWEEIETLSGGTTPQSSAQAFIVKDNDSFRAASEVFRTADGSSHHVVGMLVELENVHDGRYPDVIHDASTSANTNTTTVDTGTAENGGIALSFMGFVDNDASSGAIGHSANWNELHEIETTDGSTIWVRAALAWDDVNTSDTFSLSTQADRTYGILLSFTEFTQSVTQDIILATADEGESWLLAPTNFASNILGTPRAFKAWNGFLWFTTAFGMYRMRYGEDEYLAGNQTINIAIEQVAEFRDFPTGDNAGKWMEIYDNAVYTGIGEALYRYTEGGGFEPVFPTDDWATVGGQIRAIVRAGRMLFFGAGDFLWMFTGRSFHPVADPAASSDMDYMAYHNGKLYLNDDPATYFNIGNPSLRPDLNDATAASYETGYYISSRLDFHKVNVLKLISEFEEQVRFTQTLNTGTVTWAYRSADGDAQDPGQAGGGDTGSTWTTITTHAKGDTSPKSTDLNPEIERRAIWLRATLTPGSAGYPYIEYVSPIGRAIPPVQRRFTIPVLLQVGLRDREGAEVYSSQSDIETAISNLQALRDPSQSPNGVDLLFEDESVAGETVRGTVVAVTPVRLQSRESAGAYWRVSVTLDELP